MSAVVEWVCRVHAHLNKFLEQHCGSDYSLGPRPFLSCPMETRAARTWVVNLWNYSLVPYLKDALKEGHQLYGQRVKTTFFAFFALFSLYSLFSLSLMGLVLL